MKTISLTILGLMIALSFAAEARRDQKREGHQQARIRQGVESGELNAAEARRLRKGQRKVDRMQRKAMKDGTVTAEEKAKIKSMQDAQSKRIYEQKHDEQKREESNQ